jgi:paraquat-inducible protein A
MGDKKRQSIVNNIVSAKVSGLAGCHICGQVMRLNDEHHALCPRCGSGVHYRKNNAISRAWALLISAFIMYIPANTEPIMRSISLGDESSDTIISGVIYFLTHGDWPIALVIFLASVMLPMLKMIAIAYLLIMVQRGKVTRQREKTRLYLLAEVLGRWSMVDIFVVALMITLVQLGQLTTFEPGPAAIAFSLVVILTMFSEMVFDPKLIWDEVET